uniref:L-type lectin-like domain-containing protein n=1 Tax=Macrostomum lignano TaxID=282301 RepID=A0A1I8JGX5_9PLAT
MNANILVFIIQAFVLCIFAHQSANDIVVEQSEFAGDENPTSFLKKEYSLSKPFQGHWDFGGSTVIASDFIRLTPDSQSHRGAVWCKIPVRMRHWEVQMHFRVHGSSGNLFGDGIAFWYIDPAVSKFNGPVFGMQDKFRGLGVLLDTYSNHNGPHSHDHPYISAMVNNGSLAYDHDRDGTHSQLDGCTARFRNRDHDTLLSIRYVNNALLVATDIENKQIWQPCFRVPNVKLPTHFVFGVSAMTGDLSDNHDLLSVKVYEIEPLTWTPKPTVGWSFLRIFLLVLFCAIGLVTLLVLGLVYHTRQQRNKKRFY